MRSIASIPLIALAWPTVAAAQSVSVPLPGTKGDKPGVSLPPSAKPAVASPVGNPYGRAIDLTVNIQFYNRDLGETVIHMDKDGAITFDAENFRLAIEKVLNEDGKARLEPLIAGHSTLRPIDFAPLGIIVAFNSEDVSLEISSIDPTLRKPVSLYNEGHDSADDAVTALPSEFSFFLNTSISESRRWSGPRPGLQDPAVYFSTAARLEGFVLEAAGQFADRNPGGVDRRFRFDRNYVRLVRDIPSLYLRSYLGDLTPEVRFEQNFVQMGGFGISRQKRRFDTFRNAILQGNRQLLLQRDSTIDVYRNGTLYQQLQLGPGAYSLDNLPLLAGSNDIKIAVRDESGFAQTVNYQTYLDPIDLEPGDWEGSAYIGKLAKRFGLSPKYDGEVAFTGFFRKSFIGHPAIGFGLQASKSVQQLSGQTQLLIRSGRLDITAAASRSDLGGGYFAGFAYDLALDQSQRATSLSLQATWQSRHFTGLGAPDQDNSIVANASAILTRTFSPSLSVQTGATYLHSRGRDKDGYRIFVDGFYQLSPKWFVRGGVDYQRQGFQTIFGRQNGFGFNLAIVWRPSVRDRAEARYDYHYDDAQLSYQHSPDAYVGAVGYGGILERRAGQVSAQGYADYFGNRFGASVSHSVAGTGFGGMTERQVTTARISTAIVYAGGALALTRRVGDSFAILTPHPSLEGHDVIVGQFLTDNRYRSRSGPLGGAVNGGLGSYITQSVNYDVANPPPGYDIGEGVFRVRPPYHSGYHLVVGSDAYVTAMGVLSDPKGKPVSLGTGEVVDLSKPNEKPQPFFTNTVGRFAIPSLRPNDDYRVQLSGGQAFEFTVPAQSDGLVDLRAVTLAPNQ